MRFIGGCRWLDQSSSLSPYPLTWCIGSGTRRRQHRVWSCRRFWELRHAGADGAGGWTSGWRGEGPVPKTVPDLDEAHDFSLVAVLAVDPSRALDFFDVARS